MNNDETILDEAMRITASNRRNDYGGAFENHSRIAAIWSCIVPYSFSASDVALMMIGLKVAREAHKHKRDNLVDIAGYAFLAQVIEDEKKWRGSSLTSVPATLPDSGPASPPA